MSVSNREAPERDSRFDPSVFAELDRIARPLKELLSPVAVGMDRIPRDGPILLAGNHTVYGLLDIPLLAAEIFERTGRVVRGLGDHNHFSIPLWRDLLIGLGTVRGTRESCSRLLREGEAVLVFPGGGREVFKHKGEKYKLLWKERIGFARLAIEHGVPIVPFASVGVEDMFEIVFDADDIMKSVVGKLIRALGLMDSPWFRRGEVIPPLARGTGPAGLPRIERLYFLIGEPIGTEEFAGLHEDRDACFALRTRVQQAIESGIRDLQEVRRADPDRYPVQRALRRLAARLG